MTIHDVCCSVCGVVLNENSRYVNLNGGYTHIECIQNTVHNKYVSPYETTKRGSVLIEAHKTINGERQDVYGSPEDSFKLIADYWTKYLRSTIENDKRSYFTPSDVAMMMTLFKIARLAHGPQHKDGYIDGCGYLALAADMQESAK